MTRSTAVRLDVLTVLEWWEEVEDEIMAECNQVRKDGEEKYDFPLSRDNECDRNLIQVLSRRADWHWVEALLGHLAGPSIREVRIKTPLANIYVIYLQLEEAHE